MKKIFMAVSFCMMLFMASGAWGYTIYYNGTAGWTYGNADTLLGYAEFSPSNEAQELAFANSVLGIYGMPSTELLNGTGEKYTFPNSDTKSTNFDPRFAWEYAVVKVDGPNDYYYLLWDTYTAPSGNDIVDTPAAGTAPFNMGSPAKGISHITFFGPTSVPEPMSILLLGLGLVGLAGVGRKLKK